MMEKKKKTNPAERCNKKLKWISLIYQK